MPNSRNPHKSGMATWKTWCGLGAMTLALFMVSADLTMLFIAQPAIGADLRPGATQALWIIHIGEFLASSLVITMGKLGDRLGRKRLLMIGMAGYGTASVLAAFAPTIEVLIGARALIGVATAAITPSAIALMRSMFTDTRQFARAFSILMAAFTAGMAFGPPLGGFLVDYFWWGAVFLSTVPAAVILLVVAPWALPEFRDHQQVRLDPPSILLSIVTIMGVIYGVQQAAEGTIRLHHVVIALIGIAAGYAFVRRQRALHDPLLNLSLLKSREVRVALPALFLTMIALAGPDILIGPYLQIGLELTPAQAGLVLFIPAAATVPVTLLTPWMKNRFGLRGGIALCLTIIATGLATAALALQSSGSTVALAILTTGLVIVGVGAPVTTLFSELLVASAPLQRTGSMGALRDLSSTLGAATGIALIGTTSAIAYRTALTTPSTLPAHQATTASDSAGSAADIATRLEPETRDTFLESIRESTGLGLQAGLGIATATCLGVLLLITFKLPKKATETQPEESALQNT